MDCVMRISKRLWKKKKETSGHGRTVNHDLFSLSVSVFPKKYVIKNLSPYLPPVYKNKPDLSPFIMPFPAS